jgi:DNA-binding IclR family transcriptional regulator
MKIRAGEAALAGLSVAAPTLQPFLHARCGNSRTSGWLRMVKKSSQTTKKAVATDTGGRKYRAPALEKGLDVLELLAAEKAPLNLSTISERLGRSAGELFRMLQVLEYKGFITFSETGAGYVLSNKLFALGMAQAPVRSLVEVALPIMRRLSHAIGQSCHIAVPSEDQIVVIARIERPGDLGFSVRVGYRREITRATSGLVLFAFQTDEVRRLWLRRCGLKGAAADEFVTRAEAVRTRGYHQAASHFVQGIVDLSAPVMRGESAVAALTIPFVHSMPLVAAKESTIGQVREAAAHISSELALGDFS